MMHVPMGRAHRESSVSKLDYDAKRVANIHIWNYPPVVRCSIIVIVPSLAHTGHVMCTRCTNIHELHV